MWPSQEKSLGTPDLEERRVEEIRYQICRSILQKQKKTSTRKLSLCSNLSFPPSLLRRLKKREGGLKLWLIPQFPSQNGLGEPQHDHFSSPDSPQIFGRPPPPLYIQTGSRLTWTLSSGLVNRLISRTTMEADGQTAL